jgi:hypothetical protein
MWMRRQYSAVDGSARSTSDMTHYFGRQREVASSCVHPTDALLLEERPPCSPTRVRQLHEQQVRCA